MRKFFAAVAVLGALGLAGTAVGQRALDYNNGPQTITGTAGSDVLHGGTGPDTIKGLGGNDRIWGNEAPDVILGGEGNDHLNGNDSGMTRDTLDGGPGTDHCRGTSKDVYVHCEVIEIVRGLGPR